MTTTNLTDQVASLTKQLDRSPAQFVQSFGLHGYRVISRVKTPTSAEDVAAELQAFVDSFNKLLAKTEELRRSTPARIEGEPTEWQLPRLKIEVVTSDQELEQAACQAIRAEQIYQQVAAELKVAQSTSEASCSDSSALQQ